MTLSKDALLGACIALLVPISASLIVTYSDVQRLKEVKADKLEVERMNAEFGKQMALNTQAIRNLDTTLGKLTDYIHALQEEDRNNGERKSILSQ